MMKLWHSRKIDDILKEIGTTKNGLTTEEANERLKKYGLNEIPKAKKKGIIKTFSHQFVNPIIYILVIIVILSFLIGEITDGIFITFVIVFDALLGTFQEWKAGKESESLQSLIKVQVKVLRDGKTKKIDSENLIIGDIVLLQSGDKISGDLRLIETQNLTIDEAILTGESMPSLKFNYVMPETTLVSDRENMAYAGTTVTTGRGMGVVVATGINTEIGKIANEVLLVKDTKSPLELRMAKFIKHISVFMLIIALFLMLLLFIRNYALDNIFFSVIGLSVSAIPEGLPLALTLALSIASRRMAKRNVIVKKLNAVESLGSCTVIATDKTGTLTLNQQTAKLIVMSNGEQFKIEGIGYNDEGKVLPINGNRNFTKVTDLAILGLINNEANLTKTNNEWKHNGDSIDVAFLSLAYKLGINQDIKKTKMIVGNIPYESENKYSATFYKDQGKTFCTVKGSVEVVLNFCKTMQMGDKEVKIDSNLIMNQNEELAKNGYRVIAIAQGEKVNFRKKNNYTVDDIPKLTLIGLVGFIDPIRNETIDSINKCHKAGIKVVMITGDHPLTAFAIAKELKMVKKEAEVVNGEELEQYFKRGEKEFDQLVKRKIVFSRVTPLQKLAIIQSFKRQGEFITVTGDGVNDAPAMKAANISVAMGSGADVAKETGTMIITDDNFLSIVAGIEEGRSAYKNIRKVIYMLISTGFSEVLFFLLAILFNYPVPLLAVQLLWLNLVTDGLQDIALAYEKQQEEEMLEKPREPNEGIFNKLLIQETLVSGTAIGLIVFLFWVYLINYIHMDVGQARGYVLLLMVFMQNIHMFNCRSELKSAFKIPFNNNPFIIVSIMLVLLLQFLVTKNAMLSKILQTTRISVNHIFIIFLLALPILLIMEIFKKLKRDDII